MPEPERAFPRWMLWVASRRWGSWLTRTVFAPADKLVYRMTKGRRALSPPGSVLVLTTTGRRSGLPRAVPILYLRDGDRFWVMASNYGREHHPAWSHNLLAHPDAVAEVGGRPVQVTARLASDDEKRELWPRLLEVYPAWSNYTTWTDRDFRLFCLEPAATTEA